MPLRDHFHPPLANQRSWDEVLGGWPMMIVSRLNAKLPPRYVAAPRVHLGAEYEIDVSAYEQDGQSEPASLAAASESSSGGVAMAVWAPPRPTLDVVADPPEMDEYEVRVYDAKHQRRLVAAVEIVSPANKDLPDHRRALVGKCAVLLQQKVCVVIVDLVTTREPNLYGELLDFVGQTDSFLSPEPPPLYTVASRWRHDAESWLFESWAYAMRIGQPISTVPLWLADNLAVPLELEESYEETCRILRIT